MLIFIRKTKEKWTCGNRTTHYVVFCSLVDLSELKKKNRLGFNTDAMAKTFCACSMFGGDVST